LYYHNNITPAHVEQFNVVEVICYEVVISLYHYCVQGFWGCVHYCYCGLGLLYFTWPRLRS